jgi:hypothetical protein
MQIKQITILLTFATDKVMLKTDLPCPYVPEFMPSQESLIMGFDCTYDTAKAYVAKHFPDIPVEVINLRGE